MSDRNKDVQEMGILEVLARGIMAFIQLLDRAVTAYEQDVAKRLYGGSMKPAAADENFGKKPNVPSDTARSPDPVDDKPKAEQSKEEKEAEAARRKFLFDALEKAGDKRHSRTATKTLEDAYTEAVKAGKIVEAGATPAQSPAAKAPKEASAPAVTTEETKAPDALPSDFFDEEDKAETKTKPVEVKKRTLTEVREIAVRVANAKGGPAVLALITKVSPGATKLSNVPEDMYGELYAACELELAK